MMSAKLSGGGGDGGKQSPLKQFSFFLLLSQWVCVGEPSRLHGARLNSFSLFAKPDFVLEAPTFFPSLASLLCSYLSEAGRASVAGSLLRSYFRKAVTKRKVASTCGL